MSIRNLIILSQVNPPAQRNHVLNRERINQVLNTALEYPLTVLRAGTGYGKSTAIISFLNTISLPIYWYTMSGSDRDPTLFLAKLFTAFNQRGEKIGDEALRILDLPDSTQQEAMIAFINALSTRIKEPSIFILDDFHRVCDIPEILEQVDWLIGNLPTHLHIITATRRTIPFPSFNKWHVQGTVLEIDKEDLIFSKEEIATLFNHQYGIQLQSNEVDQLYQKTEGWAIALQMVWQSLQNNPLVNMQQVLEDNQESRTALFAYLADEVLSRQDQDTQDFLLKTSILSKLDADTCDFLLTTTASEKTLSRLHNLGLFIEELRPNVYRYHQVFREFLQNRLQRNPELSTELHRKIASYFSAHEYWEQAISHLISAGDYRQVNQVLENIGEQMIQEGRYESIHFWIKAFPETLRKNYPYISFLLGEVNRYMSHFEQALEFYHSAERLYRVTGNSWGTSMALRGQAQIYLDTIRPLNAINLLQEALELLNPNEAPGDVASLLSLIAENQLNLGNPENAERLLHQSNQLNPLGTENDLIQARIYLRTGRLKEGIALLVNREARHPAASSVARPQRFHREASLLLSLFYAIQGNIEETYRFAHRGISIGEQLQSTFVLSVGYMRLGHAHQLQNKYPWTSRGFEKASEYYQQSIEKVDVTRIHVEPLWGMCRALGYSQKIQQAEELALESLSIAQKAGDIWIGVMIQISLGAGEVLAKNYEKAHHYLTLAESGAVKVKDPFTLCAAQMWLAINAWQQGYLNSAFIYLEKLLPIIHENHYEYLLTKETFLGLNDREIIIPLLLATREHNIESDTIQDILKTRHLVNRKYHPGYSIWVRTLGSFNIWRGSERVEPQQWKREKARHLFQLLVANRGKMLHRDQIMNMLWPDVDIAQASNNLKVVLNTLNQVLEPERPRGKTPFFVERNQEFYRFNPDANIIIDTDIFETSISNDTQQSLKIAVDLYDGQYFNDSYVQEWLMVEEQYYQQQFLLAAEKLAELLIEQEKFQEALDVTYKILSKDAFCESGHALQMIIFHKMERYSMVHSVFQDYARSFENQFHISVSNKLEELYQELIKEEQNQSSSHFVTHL